MLTKIIHHLKWKYRYYNNITLKQRKYSRLLDPRVRQGPFQGMYYIKSSVGSVVLPKLIGTYEKEIQHIFRSLNITYYDAILDIGAAEGYYAVGLARKFPDKKIIAYELTSEGRKIIKKLSKLNKVKNVEIRNKSTTDSLRQVLKEYQRTFILMDIEGLEQEQLFPEKIPALLNQDILVEIHMNKNKNMLDIISKRFSQTHDLEFIKPQQRKESDIEGVNDFLRNNFKVLTNEYRSNSAWLFMTIKK